MAKGVVVASGQFAVLSFEFGHVGQLFFVGLFGFEPTFEEVFRYFAHGEKLVQSTTELCLGKKCPYRKECFHMKTRMEKMEADILILNHHVFFADLNVRAETDFDSEYLILPRYDMVIFDEAHNIESVARSYFSVEVSKISFTRLLNRIYQKKNKRKKEKSALIRVEDTIDEKDLEDSQQYIYF